jgi:hypothetical protein
MKRLALLIAAPKLKDHPDLPGTEVDVRKMRQWLRTNQGGAWEADEIQTFINPKWEDLKPWVKQQAAADYAFTLFAGHGYMVSADYGAYETAVCLRDGEDLRVKDLNPGNKRCTILADCCRGLTVDIPSELIEEQRAFAKFAEAPDRQRFRDLFDGSVLAAEQGAIYLYSCDKDESAADDDVDGGLFTFHFLKAAREWASNRLPYSVMTLDQTFAAASGRTKAAVPQQKPQLNGGRRLRYFPFGVA